MYPACGSASIFLSPPIDKSPRLLYNPDRFKHMATPPGVTPRPRPRRMLFIVLTFQKAEILRIIMDEEQDKKLALTGDPKRQATAIISGYAYQIWQSVHAWLDLQDEDFLFLEGAEDFEVIEPEKATAIQVKKRTGTISLGTKPVIEAINHYWKLRTANKGRNVSYRYLTTSSICVEKGNPFGKQEAGLTLWEKCQKGREGVKPLKEFLLEQENLSSELRIFLSQANENSILEQLVQPMTWETESEDASYVIESIKRKLIVIGENYGIISFEVTRVAERLFSEALTTACSRDKRLLDRALLLQIFGDEATMRVPKNKVFELISALQGGNLFSAVFPSEATSISFRPAPLFQKGIPPIPRNADNRDKLVAELGAILKESNILVLVGLAGMGKTTLAKLVANKEGGNWYWVNLSIQETALTTVILRQLVSIIEQKRESCNIVLDDLDLTPAPARQYEDCLGGLLYTLKERNNQVIITSQKSPPDRLLKLLSLEATSLQQVPQFGEDEIVQFALNLGCPRENLAQNWAKVISLQTYGHPQLVHARLIKLQNDRWPICRLEELLETPPEIARVRTEAREVLIRQVPENHRELIYRLSIVAGYVRRDQAIAIGEFPPAVSYPGDVFDWLVGPWIESIGGDYFRLSPLLKDAAKQVWPGEKIKLLNGIVAKAILRTGRLTTYEAFSIFIHAFAGRSSEALVPVIYGILNAPKEVWKSISKDLSWLIHVCIEPPSPIFPESALTNFILRMFQFRIAVEIEPQTASRIAEVWDQETSLREPRKAFLMKRFMLASHVITYYQAEIAPRKLLAYLLEMTNIQEEMAEINELLKHLEKNGRTLSKGENIEFLPFFFVFILPRCNGIAFLDELMEGLKDTPPTFRERVVATFKTMETQAIFLINRVWMREVDSKEHNWAGCISVFQNTMELAIQWGVPALASAAARGSAIIYDEYLQNPSQALAVLEMATEQIGPHVYLEDERAIIMSRQKRHKEALTIWENILSKWHPSPEKAETLPIFSCRNAGIAAANTGDWRRAANLFLEGHRRAKEVNYQALATGLLGDAGFAFYQAHEYMDSVNSYFELLSGQEGLPDPDKEFNTFAAIKFVGHTLAYIQTILTGEPLGKLGIPTPGMCSNTDYDEKLRELPILPIDYFWFMLVEIEYNLDTGSIVYNYVYQHLRDSKYPELRLMLTRFGIERSFRIQEFESLPTQSTTLSATYNLARGRYAQGKQLWEPAAINGKLEAEEANGSEYSVSLLLGALVALVSANKYSLDIFNSWRKQTEAGPLSEATIKFIDLAETILSREISGAITIMLDNRQEIEIRTLAALRVCLEETVNPDPLFYSHIMLSTNLRKFNWISDVENALAELISKQWLSKINFRAALRSPQLTIPEIEKACRNDTKGLQKAAMVLLAVSNAVSVCLPGRTIEELNNLVKGQGTTLGI